ncbi:MAG TPA: O-antigen ligase family protein [Candidatus Woesebacteria bacterium]|nr:O-antigen ligase family protein [Candidatus Woesebacteria bacterium]
MAKKHTFKQTLVNFIDQHLLFYASLFLLIFIPLYPKIPLFDAIPGYIVRVRLEDIFVGLTTLFYLIQVWRKKVSWKNPVAKWILAYIAVAFLSIISGLFIIRTIPLETIHLAKSVLHLLRYIEYFALLFILYSSIKSEKDLQVVIYVLALTVLLVSIYGYGQKYRYWPVFSTMNREFSKGMVLYLTEHARVQSTFAGHYDLAAFLVLLLPIFYVLGIKSQKKLERISFKILHLIGLWLLVVSASRTSFAAYLLAILFAIIFLAWQEQSLLKRLWAILRRGLSFSVLILLMILLFGGDMQDRFLQLLRAYPEAYTAYEESVQFSEEQIALLEDKYENLAKFVKNRGNPPDNGLAVDENTAFTADNTITRTDEQPVSSRPVDVYEDIPDKVLEEDSQGNLVVVEKERTWSPNAMKYGLSLAIRLDELWPNAIRGFMTNPLLGSAYGTLNKKEFYQFTEAESTDNNFLRTLGETGLLGFITFYGIFLVIFYQIKQNQKASPWLKNLNLAFMAASLGLLANALYIDVFASSKVAFTYWALAGAILAINYQQSHEAKTKQTQTQRQRLTSQKKQ